MAVDFTCIKLDLNLRKLCVCVFKIPLPLGYTIHEFTTIYFLFLYLFKG